MIDKVFKSAVIFLLCLAPLAAQHPEAKSVVVVANSLVPGSEEVANAYMKRRGIPQGNKILIEAPAQEGISRTQYIETIHNPVLQALVDKELVNAFEGDPDSMGRLTAVVLKNPIRYMVLCYGVPVRINNLPPASLDDLELRKKLLSRSDPLLIDKFSEGPLARSVASVDSEMALILEKDMPVNGFVPNPFYRQFRPQPGLAEDVIKVTRLDGPSPEAVIRMIDNAIEGEKNGLKGRAYVDEDGRGGNYAAGNTWLERTAEVLTAMGFDVQHDTERKTFQVDDRFDAPVLYAGWYSSQVNGPFSLPGFRFPPGAVAAHLHSYSAANIRSKTKNWVGPLVDKGVSATFGNVAEPYLAFTHHFNLFFAALGQGWNFADAAYLALPGLSWQGVAVGDPLYRPFATSLEEQLDAIGDPLAILEDQYVILRQARLAANSGDEAATMKIVERGMREAPGLALGLERARLLEAEGKRRKARKSLQFLSGLKPTNSLEWGLFAELADTLDRLGDTDAGLDIYQHLERLKMPEPVKTAFLKRGIPLASKAGETRLAVDWQTRVIPPPPPPPPESETAPVNGGQEESETPKE